MSSQQSVSPAVAAQNGEAQPATPKPQAPAEAISRDPAILLLDQKRRIVAANPPCATLFGQSQHALAGVQLESMLKADNQNELETFLQVAGGADRGEYKATIAVTILRKDGTAWPGRVTIKRLWHHPQYCWTVAFQGAMPPADLQPSPAATPAHTHTETARPSPVAVPQKLQMATPESDAKLKSPSPPAQAMPPESAPKTTDDRSTLIQRIYTSEMKLSAAQDELKEANTSLDALQREFEGVAAAKADAEQQLEELRKIQGAVELERLKAELKKQAEERQRTEKELRAQLDEAKAVAEQLKRDDAAELERARTATHQQSQDRGRIETELRAQQNAAKTAAEQSAAVLKEKEGQCARLEEELTKVRQTRNELEQKQQKITAELESTKTELQQQSQERQRLEKELRDQQSAARDAAEENGAALKEKENENTGLEEELTRTRQARDESEQQKRQVAGDLDRAKAELQQQAQERQRAEAELQNAARTAAEQNALALKEKDGRYAQLEEELAKVRQGRDEFEQQQRKTAADLGRAKSELQQHAHERQRAEADLREELDAAKSVADETANMLEEKIAGCHQLEGDLAELRRVRDNLEEQQRRTAASLERLRIESQQLSQDRQRAEAELRGKLDVAKAAAEKSTADLRQTENRCIQLEEELTGLRPMCAELQQQLHQSVQDLERARAGFQRQSQDRQRLEAELRVKVETTKAAAEQNANDLKEKENRCTQLEEELAGLRPMCGELQQQLHQSVMDQERAKGEFQHQLQQRRRVEKDLSEQLEAVKAAAAQANADFEEKAARSNLLEEALIGVRRVRDELEQDKIAGVTELERAKAELQRQAQDHQRVEADLRAHLSAAKTAAEESAGVLKEKEAHWARLEGELAQARLTRDELEQRKHEGATELERARAELQQLSQNRQRVETDLRAQLGAAKSAAEKSAGVLKEKEARWARLEEELAQARQTRDELEQRRREGAAELERARAELQQQSTQVESGLRAKLDAANTAAEQSTNVLREKEAECTRLQGELAWANQIREEIEQHKRAGAEELERVKSEFERQSHEQERIEADLRKQLDVADSAAESNVSALKEQEGRLTILEGELSKVRRTRDEFEQHQRQNAAELERVKAELQQLSEEIHEWESECQKLTETKESLTQELSRLRESAASRPAADAAAPAARVDSKPAANAGQSFRLHAPSAIQVYLAGDFTEWREAAIPMQKGRDGEWTTTVNLPPGTYNYLFIVDREWRIDPECPTKVPNQFGGQNSVRRIS